MTSYREAVSFTPRPL